jgi:hypothetical protein
MADKCIICGHSDEKLTQCRDISSWITLYRAAVVRGHKTILEALTSENEFPLYPIKYHRNCRAEFTNKRDLQVATTLSDDATTESITLRVKMEHSQARVFCLTTVCFARNRSTSQEQSQERSFIVSRNFALMNR